VNGEAVSAAPWMPLHAVSAGRSVVLRRIGAGHGLTSRLTAMGLIPGAQVQVFRNDRHGPVVLSLAGSRVMLGRGLAQKLSVEAGEIRG
jgi:ferrous iron transport protein A